MPDDQTSTPARALALANLRAAGAARGDCARALDGADTLFGRDRSPGIVADLRRRDAELRRAALSFARVALDEAGESGTADACLILLQLEAAEED